MSWPNYRVAPADSVHALGVVSINYARFELTHVWMLASVANMQERQAAVVSARTNPSDRVRLIETFMSHREWPDEASTAIKHYLKAMSILTTNRNLLVHSNMVRPGRTKQPSTRFLGREAPASFNRHWRTFVRSPMT